MDVWGPFEAEVHEGLPIEVFELHAQPGGPKLDLDGVLRDFSLREVDY